MQDVIRSISLRELTWDEVDNFSKKHGFRDRSPFVEYCVAKEMHKRKLGDMKAFEIGLLLMLAVLSVGVILLWLVR